MKATLDYKGRYADQGYQVSLNWIASQTGCTLTMQGKSRGPGIDVMIIAQSQDQLEEAVVKTFERWGASERLLVDCGYDGLEKAFANHYELRKPNLFARDRKVRTVINISF